MEFDPEKITYFAKTDSRGEGVQFGIKAKDRQRHMYVIGKTGMGKSTLLENMAVQDIQNGEGMAFIDPHGAAAETLLEYIPEHRIKDVVYFAPFDTDNPISFNVMEDVGPDRRHLVVSGLMSTFKKIWVDAWSARMEYILTNALLALIEYPDSTLISVTRLFNDKAYRKKVVDNIQDPAVKSFWVDEFANYTERFAAEALPAIQNKIGQFTGNPLIRNIIGQPKSSFDIREIMDEKKILIMNLSKGLVGETNASLLGSMLTTRIYLAAMSRAELPVAKMKTMPNFYFYVDEFQSFANSTFADILSEARKYHLNLIIAHQYIEQMEEEVRDAVFGNVGTTVSFRVGPFDAEVLETVYTPTFLAADLVNLGFAQIYLTLMIDGIGSQPFSATTLPPIEPPVISYKDMVIAESRKNFTGKRAAIEELVTELHKPTVPERKPPTQKRPDNRNHSNNNNRTNNRNNNHNGNAKPESVVQHADRSNNVESSRRIERQDIPHNNVSASTDAKRVSSDVDTSMQHTDTARLSHKNTHTHKSKEKTLDDLRSVLKGMSGMDVQTDKKKHIPQEQNGSEISNNVPKDVDKNGRQNISENRQTTRQKEVFTKEHTEKRQNNNKQELQNALEGVLAVHTKQNSGTSASTSPPKTDPPPAPTPPPVSPSQSGKRKEVSDSVSVKELEKMMRVSTSDKPPLK